MKPVRSLTTFAVSLVYVLPFAVLALLALSPSGFDANTLYNPSSWRWGNFVEAWRRSSLGNALLHSFMITAGGLTLVVVCASMAAWAFVRYPIGLYS